MSEHNNVKPLLNASDRRFGVVCEYCQALSLVDLDHEPEPKKVKLDDEKHISYAFERLQHMRITLKLCRERLSTHLLADDELQRHLDNHVLLLEQSYQHLIALRQSIAKQFTKPETHVVKIVQL